MTFLWMMSHLCEAEFLEAVVIRSKCYVKIDEEQKMKVVVSNLISEAEKVQTTYFMVVN